VFLQYTIETRQLTSGTRLPPISDGAPGRLILEAADADDAISQFLRGHHSELVSLTQPLIGRESIATVRKNDRIFLVRVYAV
jgi:hypothetical protein